MYWCVCYSEQAAAEVMHPAPGQPSTTNVEIHCQDGQVDHNEPCQSSATDVETHCQDGQVLH